MATTESNTRLDVRLREEQKRLIGHAAKLLGQTISAFTVATLVRQAEEVIEHSETLRLSNRDRRTFLAALDHPPEPHARLRRAAQLHARKVAK
jgi:uncharacterized protein (DUF1778 family)